MMRVENFVWLVLLPTILHDDVIETEYDFDFHT